MAKEQLPYNGEHNGLEPSAEQLRDSNEQAERLKELHEQQAEKEQSGRNHEKEQAAAEREAKEQAKSKESQQIVEKKAAPERRGAPTKQERSKAFDNTMTSIRKDMGAPQRAFSKVIHSRPVEVASEAVGSTVARPNIIVAAGASALLFTTIAYVIAHYYGYLLSGFESIATFALGWIVGALFEYFRVGVFNKKKR